MVAAKSHWVYEEAESGRRRGILVPIRLEPVDPPLGFGSLQAGNLIDWEGDPASLAFRQLVEAITDIKPPSRVRSFFAILRQTRAPRNRNRQLRPWSAREPRRSSTDSLCPRLKPLRRLQREWTSPRHMPVQGRQLMARSRSQSQRRTHRDRKTGPTFGRGSEANDGYLRQSGYSRLYGWRGL